MIYNQRKGKKEGEPRGTCTGFAYAQLVGQITGKYPSYREVWDFYKQYDTDRRSGLSVPELTKICKTDPIGPYTLRSCKRVYGGGRPKRWARYQLRVGSKFSNTGFIVGLKIISKLLTKNGVIVPQSGPMKDLHAVYAEIYSLDPLELLIYNSYGTRWGKDGKAILKLEESWDMIHGIFRIELNIPHEK